MAIVKDASSAWKWFSVQAMALSIAIQTVWLNLPADLQARVPEVVVDYGTVVILILGLIGRFVDQGGNAE